MLCVSDASLLPLLLTKVGVKKVISCSYSLELYSLLTKSDCFDNFVVKISFMFMYILHHVD